MRVIESPSPTNGVRLHLLSNNRVGVSHARGSMANDADPSADPNANPPADVISALMKFLADRLEPADLPQAQTLIEQALSDTSTSNPAGNPASVGMDAAAARRQAERTKASKSFNDRWGTDATRIRTV
jgi:hypothetical protein